MRIFGFFGIIVSVVVLCNQAYAYETNSLCLDGEIISWKLWMNDALNRESLLEIIKGHDRVGHIYYEGDLSQINELSSWVVQLPKNINVELCPILSDCGEREIKQLPTLIIFTEKGECLYEGDQDILSVLPDL